MDDVISKLRTYLEQFHLENYEECIKEHCFARIVRLSPTDPLSEPHWLSYPQQPFPFVIGPETVCHLYNKTIMEIFDFIGYERSFIRSELERGNRYYLIFFAGYRVLRPHNKAANSETLSIKEVEDQLLSEIDEPDVEFSERHCTPLPATWSNLMTLIEEFSPTCASKVQPFLTQLQTTAYNSYEFSIDSPPVDIMKEVESFEAFSKSKLTPTVSLARAFLRHTMKCTKLYAGDGYSYDDFGNKGAKEYLMPRVKIENLLNASMIFRLTDHLEISSV